MDESLERDLLEFEIALIEFTSARAAYQQYAGDEESTEGPLIRERYEKAEEEVFAFAAPSVTSVIEKLSILWQDELVIETPDSIRKIKVMDDLRRLAAIHNEN